MKPDNGVKQCETTQGLSASSGPHLACHHSGYEFDWWRCNEVGYVGRPPSPFPASFDRGHRFHPDSADLKGRTQNSGDTGCKDANGATGDGTNGGVGAGRPCPCGHYNCGCVCGGCPNADPQRLYWPICQGPEDTGPIQAEDFGNIDNSEQTNKNKTPRLPQRRPPWIPTKMPNKWGVAGHPPPYTNYCRETMFNTKRADPSKVTIRTTF